MPTSEDPAQASDDPLIKIFLEDENSNRAHIRSIPKSKLVEHSGFFRAMFRHDFAESRSNEVTLHDDNRGALESVLDFIEKGTVRDTDLFIIKFFARDDERDPFVEALPLLDKYDCSQLQAKAIKIIGFHVERDSPYWQVEKFFEQHYDVITNIYGGAYPQELYPCFAESWKMFEMRGIPTDKMFAVVERTPTLAIFLSRFYCNKLAGVEKTAREAIEAAIEANSTIRRVTSDMAGVLKSADAFIKGFAVGCKEDFGAPRYNSGTPTAEHHNNTTADQSNFGRPPSDLSSAFSVFTASRRGIIGCCD